MTAEKMRRIFSKTWFQITAAGLALGAIFIFADGYFSDDRKIYNGPVQIEKDKAYVTEISLSEDMVDFGKSKEGDTLSRRITVTNTGKEPLIIFKKAGSCDCVAAVASNDMIGPGESTELMVYFDTKGRKGPQLRKIELTCNTDPAQVFITLKTDVE